MPDSIVVELSRLQFAMTALYHFLFVPLTLGLSFLLAIMESVYVMTGRDIWRRMVLFWGTLFGINFAMGVATGIVMEFQFGTNWSYYSHYVGDIFGAPLAIEGLMAFFLEATFIGLFFFGWNKLSKVQHLVVTWLVAIGSNLSALWILVANGWMQHPVGARFNPDTMRMEVTDFAAVIFNPVAQAKFVHTVSAGYVMGAVFVFAISAFYLLRGKHEALAKRSMAVAASFGLAAALSVVVLGDESGYSVGENQKMKLASIEAMWDTEKAPAGFNLIAFPNQQTHENHAAIHIPWVMGLIGTRSLDTEMPGINEQVAANEDRIRNGLQAYTDLQQIRGGDKDATLRADFDAKSTDLGYALLLKKYRADVQNASADEIKKAAWDTVPNVAPLFWIFRVMAGLGFYFIAFFAFAFYLASVQKLDRHRWFLKLAFASLLLPWVGAECGWIVAEYGRQPWIIDGVLPTFYAASGLTLTSVLISLIGFVLLYSVLAVIEIYLLRKLVLKGPDEIAGALNEGFGITEAATMTKA